MAEHCSPEGSGTLERGVASMAAPELCCQFPGPHCRPQRQSSFDNGDVTAYFEVHPRNIIPMSYPDFRRVEIRPARCERKERAMHPQLRL